MQLRNRISNQNLFLSSQAFSSTSNYLPLALAMSTRDVLLIGQIAVYQSLFTIFISITRSGIGYSMLKATGMGMRIGNAKFALIFLTSQTVPATFFYCRFSLDSDYSLFLLFCSILMFSILQEFFRALIISLSFYRQLAFADLVWLMASSVTALFFIGGFTLQNIAYVFFFGSFCSVMYSCLFLLRKRFIQSSSKVKSVPSFELFSLSTIPLITFLSVYILNLVWSAKYGVEDLGIVRGISFFFIPIQFLLSVFPHIILRERKSARTFFSGRRRLVLLLACSCFAITWAAYTHILNSETFFIVLALCLSMNAIITSQEISLLRIAHDHINTLLLKRFTWSVILILLACLLPPTISTPLQLAAIIAFSDVLYRLLLGSRQLEIHKDENER